MSLNPLTLKVGNRVKEKGTGVRGEVLEIGRGWVRIKVDPPAKGYPDEESMERKYVTYALDRE